MKYDKKIQKPENVEYEKTRVYAAGKIDQFHVAIMNRNKIRYKLNGSKKLQEKNHARLVFIFYRHG
jgi:hypothetical protein